MRTHTSVSDLYYFDLQDTLRMIPVCRNTQEIITCISLSLYCTNLICFLIINYKKMYERNNIKLENINSLQKQLKIKVFSYRFHTLVHDRSKGVLMFVRQNYFSAVGGQLR